MTEGKEMTEGEAAEIVRQFSEGKSNLHTFFTKVIQNPDTTRIGNLTEDELGTPHLPVRSYKELALFCEDVADQNFMKEYFDKMSEIQTSTSLSKDALLLKLAVTIKKELADVTPTKKKNKGWFGSKNKNDDSM